MTTRHYGPGNHPSGSSQDVHGGGVGEAGKAVSVQGVLKSQGPAITDLVHGDLYAKDPLKDVFTWADTTAEKALRQKQKRRAARRLADELAADPAMLDALASSADMEAFFSAGHPWAVELLIGDIGPEQTDQRREMERLLRSPWMSRSVEERRAMLENPYVRYAIAAGYIHQWAETSGDTHPDSLLVQRAAAAEFGLDYRVAGDGGYMDADGWHRKPKLNPLTGEPLPQSPAPFYQHLAEDVDARWASDGPAYRALVRATYRATQAEFAAAGVTEVTVVRGVGTPPSFVPRKPDIFGRPDRIPDWSAGHYAGAVRLNPLSSWSTEIGIARGFGDVIYSTRVPVSRIFSVSATGPSCSEEWEIILLGGEINAQVRPSQ